MDGKSKDELIKQKKVITRVLKMPIWKNDGRLETLGTFRNFSKKILATEEFEKLDFLLNHWEKEDRYKGLKDTKHFINSLKEEEKNIILKAAENFFKFIEDDPSFFKKYLN